MRDLIEKGTVLAASNAALMATTATLIGAFSNRAGAAGEFLLPLYLFLGGMVLGGMLVGGNVLLNWATRSSTDVETTFGRGVFHGIIWISATLAAAGSIFMTLAITKVAGLPVG